MCCTFRGVVLPIQSIAFLTLSLPSPLWQLEVPIDLVGGWLANTLAHWTKSHLPSKKIYLSQTTGQDIFQSLHYAWVSCLQLKASMSSFNNNFSPLLHKFNSILEVLKGRQNIFRNFGNFQKSSDLVAGTFWKSQSWQGQIWPIWLRKSWHSI